MNPIASGIPVHCAHHAIVSIHDLKPHPSNPNRHPDRQLALYSAAIQKNGWREAITVSLQSGFIISGHGAVEAARRLSLELVPVEYQNYESPAEELADLLAHNRIAELSVTDRDLLATTLRQLRDLDLVTGYNADDLEKLLADVAPAPQFPLAPKLNESHRFLVVYCDNETDWQFLKNLAGVRTERSYKNESIGEGRVRRFPDFLKSIRENVASVVPVVSPVT